MIPINSILKELAQYIEEQLQHNNTVEIGYAVLLMLSNNYRAYLVKRWLLKNGFPHDEEVKRFYFTKNELELLKKKINQLEISEKSSSEIPI